MRNRSSTKVFSARFLRPSPLRISKMIWKICNKSFTTYTLNFKFLKEKSRNTFLSGNRFSYFRKFGNFAVTFNDGVMTQVWVHYDTEHHAVWVHCNLPCWQRMYRLLPVQNSEQTYPQNWRPAAQTGSESPHYQRTESGQRNVHCLKTKHEITEKHFSITTREVANGSAQIIRISAILHVNLRKLQYTINRRNWQ